MIAPASGGRTPEITGAGELQHTPSARSEQLNTTSAMQHIEQHAQWRLLARLPLRLVSGIPLPGFKLKDLLNLRAGQMLTTTWSSSEDVPLKIGAVQMGWSEFEVVEQRMAVRLTRLA